MNMIKVTLEVIRNGVVLIRCSQTVRRKRNEKLCLSFFFQLNSSPHSENKKKLFHGIAQKCERARENNKIPS